MTTNLSFVGFNQRRFITHSNLARTTDENKSSGSHVKPALIAIATSGEHRCTARLLLLTFASKVTSSLHISKAAHRPSGNTGLSTSQFSPSMVLWEKPSA
jgi:hypothetical protein